MMAPRELAAFRQDQRQMAAPCRRIFAAPQAARLGIVEHSLDPAAKARRGFRNDCQSGCRTESTAAVSIMSTGRSRIAAQ